MGVKGRLKDMPLTDILQILHAEKRTVGLHLGSEKGFGHVYLEDGEVVHSAYLEKGGLEAFRELVSWRSGDFDVEQAETSETRTIELTFDDLMREALKKSSESGTKLGAEYSGDTESVKLIHTLIDTGILEKVGP